MSSHSTIAGSLEEPESTYLPQVVFPAGNYDFRAARNRCARACREFNKTPDDADPEERAQKWLDIVRPDRDRSEDRVLAVTHDQTFANPALKAKTPFVKPPVYIDYGIRLHVGGSTFINRNCMIMDTPVADVVIGEGCNIGANCTIIGVTHPMRLDERLQRHSIGQPVTIGNDVWIGANVTIFGGVTIGSGAVIGACSLVKHHIPPMSVAFGSPARVVKHLRDVKPCVPGSPTAGTMAEAVRMRNRLPMRHATSSSFLHHDEGSGPGDGEGSVEEGEEDGHRMDIMGGRRQSPFAMRARLNTARRVAERLELDSEGELRGLLLRERKQKERRMRRFEVEAIAVVTVAVTLLMAFFFTGVWFGASRVAVMGA